MSKKGIENFIGDTGYVCSKCGKIVIEGKTHENQEGICEDCLITELQQQLAEKDKKNEYLKRKWDITKDCLKRKTEAYELQFNKCQQLKQQLAEKDKEIESWKENSKMWENWKETYYKKLTEARQQLKDQRHQICEEIKRIFYDNWKEMKLWWLSNGKCKELEEIFDQIEKGE